MKIYADTQLKMMNLVEVVEVWLWGEIFLFRSWWVADFFVKRCNEMICFNALEKTWFVDLILLGLKMVK